MIRTQVYIPEDLYKKAKLLARQSGVSISQLLREGLKQGLKLHKRTAPKKTLGDCIGIFSTKGDKNAALNHDEIYEVPL